tara:strand:+ start:20591 stop:28648 length:8058 start_codon:yes stop_codon:yes gene_type:complete
MADEKEFPDSGFQPGFFLTLAQQADDDKFWERAEADYKRAIGEPVDEPVFATGAVPKPKTPAQIAKQQQNIIDLGTPESELPQLSPTLARHASPEVALNLRHSLSQGTQIDEKEKHMYFTRHYIQSEPFRKRVDLDFEAGNMTPAQQNRVQFAREVLAQMGESSELKDLQNEIDSVEKAIANLPQAPRARTDVIVGSSYDKEDQKLIAERGTLVRELKKKKAEMLKSQEGVESFLAGVDSAVIQTTGVGPSKRLRVNTTRDPLTGKVALDIDTTFPLLTRAYTRDILQDRGLSYTNASPEQLREVHQIAHDKAASDIISVGLRMRDSIFYDSNVPVVEDLAEKPAWERRLLSFSKRKVGTGNTHWIGRKIGLPQDTYGVFNPTVDELAREGTLSWTMRMSPMDYQAIKMKMIRDVLTKNGKELMDIDDAALYAYAYINPFLSSTVAAANLPAGALGIELSAPDTDDIMRDLGITPEQEVETFLRGHYHLDEGRAIQGEMSAMMAKAFGASKAEQFKARESTENSKWSAVAPFMTYFVDPDLITLSLLGFGKGISMALKLHRFHKLNKFADRMDEAAADPAMTYDKFRQTLREEDPAKAQVLQTYVEGKLGEPSGTISSLDEHRRTIKQAYRDSQKELKNTAPEAVDTIPYKQVETMLERERIVDTITAKEKIAAKAIDNFKKAEIALNDAKANVLPVPRRQTHWRTEFEPGGVARPAPKSAEEAAIAAKVDARIPHSPKIGSITSKEIREAAAAVPEGSPSGFVSGIRFQMDLGELKILSAEIPENLRHRGMGFELYLQALKEAKNKGYGFRSGDGLKQPPVMKLYKDLEEAGVPLRVSVEDVPNTTLRVHDFSLPANDLAKLDLDKVLEAYQAKHADKGPGPLFNRPGMVVRETAPQFLLPLFDNLEEAASAVQKAKGQVKKAKDDLRQFDNSLPYGPEHPFVVDSMGRQFDIKDVIKLRKAAEKDPYIYKILDDMIQLKSEEVALLRFGVDDIQKEMRKLYIEYRKQKGIRRGLEKSAAKLREYEAQLAIENSLSVPFQKYVYMQNQVQQMVGQLSPVSAKIDELNSIETSFVGIWKHQKTLDDFRKTKDLSPDFVQIQRDPLPGQIMEGLETSPGDFNRRMADLFDESGAYLTAETTRRSLIIELQTFLNERKKNALKQHNLVEAPASHKELIDQITDLKAIRKEIEDTIKKTETELRVIASSSSRHQWFELQRKVLKLQDARSVIKEELDAHKASSKVDYIGTPQLPRMLRDAGLEREFEAATQWIEKNGSVKAREVLEDLKIGERGSTFLGLNRVDFQKTLEAIRESKGPIGWNKKLKEIESRYKDAHWELKEARKDRRYVNKMAQKEYDLLTAKAEAGDVAAQEALKGVITKEQEDLYKKLLDQSRAESRRLKKAEELFVGDVALTKMEENYALLNKKRRSLLPQIVRANRELKSLVSKAYAANPQKLKAAINKRKEDLKGTKDQKAKAKGTTLTGQILSEQQKVIDALFRTHQKVKKAKKAARWRKIAKQGADDFRKLAEVSRKKASTISLFPRTGLQTVKENAHIGQKIFGKAIKEVGPANVPMPKMALRLTPDVTEASLDTANGIKISGTVDDGQFLIKEFEVPSPLKNSTEEAHAIAETFDFAHRNSYSLVLSPEAGNMRFNLQAAQVRFSGKKGQWTSTREMIQELESPIVRESLEFNSSILEINPAGLRNKIVKEFGEDALEQTIARNGADGQLLKSVLESSGPVRITAREAGALQDDLATSLAVWAERLLPENQELKLASEMAEASIAYSINNPGVKGLLYKGLNALVWQFDPQLARIGLASKHQDDILKAGENLFDQSKGELASILRGVGDQDAAVSKIHMYLDGTQSYTMTMNRTTVMNVGPKTHFERAKEYAAADKGTYALKGGKKGAKETQKVDAAQGYADVQSLLRDGANPFILGVSRMWLPRGWTASQGLGKTLYSQARKVIANSSSYEEMAKKMWGLTAKHLEPHVGKIELKDGTKITNLDARVVRVHTLGAMATLWGSMTHDLGRIARKSMGGVITSAEAKDLTRFFSGEFTSVKDVDLVFNTLRTLGHSSANPKVKILFRGLARTSEELTQKLVNTALGPDGDNLLALAPIRRQLAKSLDGDIKTLDALPALDPAAGTNSAFWLGRKYLLILKQGLTRGFFIRSEGHIQFQMAGDWNQMWFEKKIGFTTASKIFAQNEVMTIPVLGRALQDHISNTSKKVGHKKPVLRSTVETIYNPHIADFWQGKDFFVRVGKDGPIHSGDQIRKAFIEGGVLETPIAEDLVREAQQLSRTTPEFRKLSKLMGAVPARAKKFLKDWDRIVEDSVVAMQQRQRVGTGLILMKEGHSLSESVNLVNKAIYDWKHGISQAELLYHLQILPYYRWFRLAQKQFFSAILDPITKPNIQKMAETLAGQTQFNAFRQMYRGQQDVMPILLGMESPEELFETRSYHDALAPAYVPPWMKETYPVTGIEPATQAEIERKAKTGRTVTHWASIGPMQSLVDVAKINMGFALLGGSIIAMAKGESAAAKDLRIKGLDGLTGLMYPFLRETINPMVGVTQYHPELGVEWQPINDSHAAIIQSIDPDGVRIDPETKKPYGHANWRFLFSAVPGFIGTLPRIVDAAYVKNRGLDSDIWDYTKSLIGNYTRWNRTYPVDINVEAQRRRRDAAVHLSGLKRKAALEKQ